VTASLRDHPLFAGVPEDVLAALATRLEERVLAEGEVLFQEGDVGDAIHVVVRGRIAIRKDDRTLALLEPGQVLGEMSLLEAEPRSADAVAATQAVVHSIGHAELRTFLLDHPEGGARFLLALGRELSRRLRRTSEFLATVHETGRIAASALPLPEMADRLLARLRADVGEAGGASLLLHNPFAEAFEVVGRRGETGVGPEEVDALLKAHAGQDRFQAVSGGHVVLGAPLRGDEGEVLGALLLEKPGEVVFPPQVEVVLSAVAHQTGLGILRAHARRDEDDRRRLERGRLAR
jgi:CRP-like cAMP-binding protein